MGMFCTVMDGYDLHVATGPVSSHLSDLLYMLSIFPEPLMPPTFLVYLVFCTINTFTWFFVQFCLHSLLHSPSILFKSCNVLFNLNRQEQNAVF